VFHYEGKSAFAKRVHFLVHGVHHKWPHDKLRLVFPPGASIPLYVGFMGLFVLTLGRYEFNLGLDEHEALALPRWVDAAGLRAELERLRGTLTFGDIYARVIS